MVPHAGTLPDVTGQFDPYNRNAAPSRRSQLSATAYPRICWPTFPCRRKLDRLSRYLLTAVLVCWEANPMRFSRFHLSISVLVLSLLLACPAFANTVSMTYLGG